MGFRQPRRRHTCIESPAVGTVFDAVAVGIGQVRARADFGFLVIGESVAVGVQGRVVAALVVVGVEAVGDLVGVGKAVVVGVGLVRVGGVGVGLGKG